MPTETIPSWDCNLPRDLVTALPVDAVQDAFHRLAPLLGAATHRAPVRVVRAEPGAAGLACVFPSSPLAAARRAVCWNQGLPKKRPRRVRVVFVVQALGDHPGQKEMPG